MIEHMPKRPDRFRKELEALIFIVFYVGGLVWAVWKSGQ